MLQAEQLIIIFTLTVLLNTNQKQPLIEKSMRGGCYPNLVSGVS